MKLSTEILRDRLPSAIGFFLVSFFFLKFLWWDTLERVQTTARWIPVEARILSNHIGLDSANGDYEFSVRFEAEVNGDQRTFKAFLNSGSKGHMENYRDNHYPVGGTLRIFINPDNLDEYSLRRESPLGAWLAGFLPGVIFSLSAISILWKGAGIKDKKKAVLGGRL